MYIFALVACFGSLTVLVGFAVAAVVFMNQ
jgi:hypothetical protein